MDESPEIERVVQEVLRRLRGDAMAGSERAPAAESAGAADELIVTERLVTGSMLEGRLNGVRTVRVPAKAVVTPAARDVVRAAGASLAVSLGAANGAAGLAVGVAETRFDAAALVEMLHRQTIEVHETMSLSLAETIDDLAASVRGGRLALLLTGKAAAALCLANRLRGVRAAQAGSAGEAAQTVAGVGANFLVVDPSGKGLFVLSEMVSAFCRPGPRACPAAWRQRLE